MAEFVGANRTCTAQLVQQTLRRRAQRAQRALASPIVDGAEAAAPAAPQRAGARCLARSGRAEGGDVAGAPSSVAPTAVEENPPPHLLEHPPRDELRRGALAPPELDTRDWAAAAGGGAGPAASPWAPPGGELVATRALALPREPGAPGAGAAAHVRAALAPELQTFLFYARMPYLHSAAAAEPRASSPVDVHTCVRRAAISRGLVDVWGAAATELDAKEAALDEAAAAVVPAWRAGGAATEMRAEGVLHFMLVVASASASTSADLAAAAPELGALAAAHLADTVAGSGAMRRFIRQAQAFLGELREDGSAGSYVAASAALVRVVVAAVAELACVDEECAKWAAARAPSAWHDPFWGHLAAHAAQPGASALESMLGAGGSASEMSVEARELLS